MSRIAQSPESQVIERNQHLFTDKNVLCAGNIQDDFVANLKCQSVKVHFTQYHHYLRLEKHLGSNAYFGLLPDDCLFTNTDRLIYFWPKSKAEAQFQLASLLNKLSKGAEIFIVGENRSGVRSAENLLADFGTIQKIDTARRCSLYHFQADSRLAFDLNEWWSSYKLSYNNQNISVKTLPGVFSHQHLDVGSELLLTALLENPKLIKGNVLDVGSGAGVLSAAIGRSHPDLTFTLSDVSAVALASSEATLAANQLQGKVIASDIFSNITDKFDLIISNPPFHDGLETSYFAAEMLIQQARKHLKAYGKLCIVANSFLTYPDLLDRTFGKHEVIKQTGKFKVYLASV